MFAYAVVLPKICVSVYRTPVETPQCWFPKNFRFLGQLLLGLPFFLGAPSNLQRLWMLTASLRRTSHGADGYRSLEEFRWLAATNENEENNTKPAPSGVPLRRNSYQKFVETGFETKF